LEGFAPNHTVLIRYAVFHLWPPFSIARMVSFTRTEYPNERHRDLEHDFVARQLSFVV